MVCMHCVHGMCQRLALVYVSGVHGGCMCLLYGVMDMGHVADQ
jgi:hypothetical protein